MHNLWDLHTNFWLINNTKKIQVGEFLPWGLHLVFLFMQIFKDYSHIILIFWMRTWTWFRLFNFFSIFFSIKISFSFKPYQHHQQYLTPFQFDSRGVKELKKTKLDKYILLRMLTICAIRKQLQAKYLKVG